MYIVGFRIHLIKIEFIVRKDCDFKRKVKDAIAIHKSQQALNRDRGQKIPPILLQLVSHDRSGHVME